MWVQKAKLFAADAAAYDEFGSSVSLSDDTALVGAPQALFLGSGPGAAYVFEKQGAFLWVQKAKLFAFDAVANDRVGHSVSLSDDTALVGAPLDDDAGPGINAGSAYVFPIGLCLTAPTPGMAAAVNTVAVGFAVPGGLVGLGFSLTPGSTFVCPGLALELDNALLVGLAIVDASGDASFSGFVPPSFAGLTILLQAADIFACEASNLVSHTFP